MRSFGGWGVVVLVLACSFDATGVDTAAPTSTATPDASEGSTSAAPTTSTSTSTGTSTPGTTDGGGMTEAVEATSDPVTTGPDPATTEPLTTGPMETTAPETTDGTTTGLTTDGTTTDATTTGVPETTGPPACDEMFFKEVLLVADAVVTAPMEEIVSGKGEGTVAFSKVAQAGTVEFTVDVPCDGEYAVWGRVQDSNPGLVDADPDSYYVRVDGGGEGGWFYGCQTDGLMSGYHWLRVTTAAQPVCGGGVWSPQLAAGSHTFRLRNREPEAFDFDVAAVARLLITNDMTYVPKLPE